MSTGVIRISAALFALALLVGVFGLNTQPTQAQQLDVKIDGARWASVPTARSYTYMGVLSQIPESDPARFERLLTESRTVRVVSGTAQGDPDAMSLTDSATEFVTGDQQYKKGVTQAEITAAEGLDQGTTAEMAVRPRRSLHCGHLMGKTT